MTKTIQIEGCPACEDGEIEVETMEITRQEAEELWRAIIKMCGSYYIMGTLISRLHSEEEVNKGEKFFEEMRESACKKFSEVLGFYPAFNFKEKQWLLYKS